MKMQIRFTAILVLLIGISIMNTFDSTAQSVPIDVMPIMVNNSTISDQLGSSSDKRYYKFQIEEKGSFKLRFDANHENPKYGWTITIMDSKYNQIYKTEKATRGFDSGEYSFAKGTYIVKVEAGWDYADYAPVGLKYDLSLHFTASDRWEIEGNDSNTTANEILLDTEYTANLYRSNDLDYYKFNIAKNGRFNVSFDVASENPKYGWTVTIMDDKMSVIHKQEQIKKSFVCPDFAFKPGTYYIKVTAGWDYADYAPVNQNYVMKVAFKAATDWESEYNDSPKTANKVKPNAKITGTLYKSSDQDYYEFILTKPSTCNLDLSFIAEKVSYGWTIKILDQNMRVLHTFKQIKTQFNSKSFKLPKGTYRIQVVAGWDYADYFPANVPYQLNIKAK